MKLAIKAFNILTVGFAVTAGFVTSMFFLGTQEEHEKMIGELIV
jgi:hypothetical protein